MQGVLKYPLLTKTTAYDCYMRKTKLIAQCLSKQWVGL